MTWHRHEVSWLRAIRWCVLAWLALALDTVIDQQLPGDQVLLTLAAALGILEGDARETH
jgi:hypothetical protein